MRARTSASQALGSMSFSRAVMIRERMADARSAPRSEPAKSQAVLPQATQRSALSLRDSMPIYEFMVAHNLW
ncbi:hypothetical protein BSY16_6128 (plasmid) [Sinorhizobium sp. RAC02]|nr:hypothetical protein BSY16_6128 [Sinorhizobium sp. RAC02]